MKTYSNQYKKFETEGNRVATEILSGSNGSRMSTLYGMNCFIAEHLLHPQPPRDYEDMTVAEDVRKQLRSACDEALTSVPEDTVDLCENGFVAGLEAAIKNQR